MEAEAKHFTCVVVGEQSLLIQCCDMMLARGHQVLAVVSEDRRIAQWCSERGISRLDDFETVRQAPAFDYLFSITNLKLLPGWLLDQPGKSAINFHDGPLPRYAGLNAPVWALINGEQQHGITWHRMAAGADTGPILVSRRFPIAEDDTAFSLNAQCYQEGLAAFSELVQGIEQDGLEPRPQDLTQRTYFGITTRPEAAAVLDWRRRAEDLERLIRALDFGPYPNPVILPKVELGKQLLLARQADVVAAEPGLEPGAIQAVNALSLTVCCGEGALKVGRLTDLKGEAADVLEIMKSIGLAVGDRLPLMTDGHATTLTEAVSTLSRHEEFWRRRLQQIQPVEVPFAINSTATGHIWRELSLPPRTGDRDSGSSLIATLTFLLARLTGKAEFSLGYVSAAIAEQPDWLGRYFSSVVPLPIVLAFDRGYDSLRADITAAISDSEERGSYLSDLRARDPRMRTVAEPEDIPVRLALVPGLVEADARRLAGGAALTVLATQDGTSLGFLANRSVLDAEGLSRLIDCFLMLHREVGSGSSRTVGELDLLSSNDRERLVLFSRNAERISSPAACIHQLFEKQVAMTPDRDACIFQGRVITYQQLNEGANRLARYLRSQGVSVGDLVGVLAERSIDMLTALYAVHKSGAAYVPLDPAYPRDRLAFMIADAGLRTVITQRAFASLAGDSNSIVMEDVADDVKALSSDNLDLVVAPDQLAYVIYTSGSTGKPKGVMVEHSNVVNFFTGLDQRIDTNPGVWLAVTSISFDISVLELFWTLSRGFTVVLYADTVRGTAPARLTAPSKKLEFGLFYWNVADDESQNSREKYRLLLEGARFADTHGFNAVWNPERHFESFGGLFPNPSVTCAALATITHNVSLRAGSCVVPLHSPIRIAEEWAVVDNLSNGRVGISIAAGWASPDFAIKPENFADAKKVMFESAEIVRRLWRGETVAFPGPKGEVQVRTLPRPLQRELPLWVTTAGNIETFVQAGKAGFNLLTHLLGQTVEEVAEKVRAYRTARISAGHSGDGTVTLMLHTFVGPDSEKVEQVVRGPLKEYLKSAMFLVKAAAWQFPTFKKMSEEQGKTLDEFFANISDEDMDAVLEFSFQRYFRTSGLFGSPASCLQMVEKVRAVGVDEIACLIDFGIDSEVVLDHLPWLDQLRAASQQIQPPRVAHDDTDDTDNTDHSLPALFLRHGVTHFQCTPAMASMLVADPMAHAGLARLRQMMVGGEAFPRDLADSLSRTVGGRVTNMYGPTETTIWSSTEDLDSPVDSGSNVSIGRPLPNQTMYILDDRQQPFPPGLAGELVIGGAGVARGYWNRPELTAERFLPDAFASSGNRMYRSGDLARYLPDGRIEFLGRGDQQVKIRGYRVELGEIETTLRIHDQVMEAAVLVREDIPGDQRLVAYVRLAPGQEVSDEHFRTWLKDQLPDFMVPSAYVRLEELPLTPNGKIDRKSLPAPLPPPGESAGYTPPQNDAETMIAGIWQRALGVPSVGTRVNFFDIGGHSLLVMQVLNELREKVPKPVKMTDLFKYTTIEALARFISETQSPTEPMNRSRERADARRAAMQRRQGR